MLNILRSDVYLGDLVWNQRERSIFAGRKGLRPADERIVHAGAHEPLVSRELAERARARIGTGGDDASAGAFAREGRLDHDVRNADAIGGLP